MADFTPEINKIYLTESERSNHGRLMLQGDRYLACVYLCVLITEIGNLRKRFVRV